MNNAYVSKLVKILRYIFSSASPSQGNGNEKVKDWQCQLKNESEMQEISSKISNKGLHQGNAPNNPSCTERSFLQLHMNDSLSLFEPEEKRRVTSRKAPMEHGQN